MENAAALPPSTTGVAVTLHEGLSVAALYEHALRRGEGRLAADGQFLAYTGRHAERSPLDKFLVREPGSELRVDWSASNRPIEPAVFERLFERVSAYLATRERYGLDAYLIAGDTARLGLRIVTDLAWHALFARTLFITPQPLAANFSPDFTILDAADFLADPGRDGTRSETFVLLHLTRRLVLIGGTHFAGEIKKAAFTLVNYLAPLGDSLPMHCSANAGPRGDTSIFFGVSGSGKTTLAADPERSFIGDDEHLWSARGVANIEGGCYAGAFELKPGSAPDIWSATHRFGAVLENVVCNSDTRTLDLGSDAFTDNTRSAYPVHFIPGARPPGTGEHPRAIVMLSCDAYGVLPPIAKLTADQARYYFLAGFGSEVRASSDGAEHEPIATFSSCFGAEFMVHHASVYANMLEARIVRHGVTCWLLNTGWRGGPCGAGSRIAISETRALLAAALDGQLDDAVFLREPAFGLAVPRAVPGVPAELLDPRAAWLDPDAYDLQARRVARLFAAHFAALAPSSSKAPAGAIVP